MIREIIFGIGRFLARHPILTIILAVAAQSLFTFDTRALWFSDEVRYAGVLHELLDRGHWLVLHLNGQIYPDKPPVYFWFLALISLFAKGATPTTFFLGSALSGLFFVLVTYALGRKVAGTDKTTSLAAALVLLANFYFMGLTHYLRMDLFFAALIVAGEILFFLGLKEDKFSCKITAGFILAAAATLTKGPLGIAFPLVTIVVFQLWTGNPKRLIRKDVLTGLALAILIFIAWAVGAYLAEGQAYLDEIFYKQIYRRAVDTWHHGHGPLHYLYTLPAVWLPWTLLLIVTPLWRLINGTFWSGLAKNRRQASGWTYVWVMFLSGFVLLSSVSSKIVVYLLPIFAPLALITAHKLLSLSKKQSALFWTATAIVYLVLAMGAPLFEFLNPWHIMVSGLGILTVLLASSAAILYWTRTSPIQSLAVLTIAMIVIIQPLAHLTLPSLNPAMSPKDQALAMRDYIQKGYYPAAFNIYSGIYTYYAGQDVYETQDWKKLDQTLAEHPKTVLAMKLKDWNKWENRPQKLKVVQEQYIVDRPYVLVVPEE